MHWDHDLWPFDPKVNRSHPWLMGSLPVKFHEDTCKGKAVMRIKPFYLTPCIVTLTFDLLTLKSTRLILDSWGVCLWSFMGIGKGEAVMRIKPFYLTPCKVNRTHPWLMGSVHVKFHEDRCEGEKLMHMKPFYLTYALWPWPLTFWPQGKQGSSLTHGECAYEVSWE